MARWTKVAAAQLGPNQESTPRTEVVARLLALLEQAIAEGVQVVVFPELALTTYFPKKIRDDADRFFETEMPSLVVAPLFERARAAGVAFHLGYAEKTPDGRYFNTAVSLARASTVEDELVTARIDLDETAAAQTRWNFLGRRHPGAYTSLVEPVRVPETKSRLGR